MGSDGGQREEKQNEKEMRKRQKRNECNKVETQSECPGKGCDED